MQATRIIAIRHGETAWNVDTRIQGHIDIPLNDTGQWQAYCTAQALAGETLDTIYSSDLQRAMCTAQAVANATGALLKPDKGLRERCFGSFEGFTFQEIEAMQPQAALRWRQRDPEFVPGCAQYQVCSEINEPKNQQCHAGESLLVLRERILDTVNRLAAQHMRGQIALVAHGGVLDMLYRLATRQDLQAPRTWTLANAAINRLLWTPGGLTLVGWGDVRHLEHQVRDESFS